jgi:hypothetical protein
MNALTIRFALPAIVIVTIIALVMIAIAFATHTHIPGTALGWPY